MRWRDLRVGDLIVWTNSIDVVLGIDAPARGEGAFDGCATVALLAIQRRDDPRTVGVDRILVRSEEFINVNIQVLRDGKRMIDR